MAVAVGAFMICSSYVGRGGLCLNATTRSDAATSVLIEMNLLARRVLRSAAKSYANSRFH
jgi:hypothetical protein